MTAWSTRLMPFCPARLLVGRGICRYSTRLLSSSSSPTTYYDSQSGMHVEHHNESEVSVYFRYPKAKQEQFESESESFQFTLEDTHPDGPDPTKLIEALAAIRAAGFVGTVLPPTKLSVLRQLVAHSVSSSSSSSESSIGRQDGSPGMMLFLDADHLRQHAPSLPSYPENVVNILFSYRDLSSLSSSSCSRTNKNDVNDATNCFREQLGLMEALLSSSSDTRTKTKTSICLNDSSQYHDHVLYASKVASLMDATGGGDLIWLTDPNEQDVIQLAEELIYLDLTGPTVKSRLVLDIMMEERRNTPQDDDGDGDDVIEECLMMGINKFVLDDVDKFEWFADLVQQQGKHIKRLNVDSNS